MGAVIDFKNRQNLLRHLAEDKSSDEQLALQIQDQEDFSTFIINTAVDGINAFDRDLRYTLWNPEMEKITGLPRSEVVGRTVYEVFPSLDNPVMREIFESIWAGKSYFSPGTQSGKLGDVEGYFRAWIFPVLDESRKITGGLSIVREVSEEQRAHEQVRKLNTQLTQTLDFLVQAGSLLTVPMDLNTATEKVIRLATTQIKGVCSLRLVRDGGQFKVFIASSDPEKERLLKEIETNYPLKWDQNVAPIAAIKQKKTIWVAENPKDFIGNFIQDQRHGELLDALNIRSYVCAPILIGDECYGVLSLYSTDRPFLVHERCVIEDLARRFAMAIAVNQIRI